MIIENLNFHFLLKPAFYLDHTFPRIRGTRTYSKDVLYLPYFLVSKLAWRWEERKNLSFIERPLYVPSVLLTLKKKIIM